MMYKNILIRQWKKHFAPDDLEKQQGAMMKTKKERAHYFVNVAHIVDQTNRSPIRVTLRCARASALDDGESREQGAGDQTRAPPARSIALQTLFRHVRRLTPDILADANAWLSCLEADAVNGHPSWVPLLKGFLRGLWVCGVVQVDEYSEIEKLIDECDRK